MDLGPCANQRCDLPATRVATLPGRSLPVCDEHYAEFTTPCAADGCPRYGWNIVALKGTTMSGEHAETEVAFCAECWERLQSSQTVTVDGRTMVHDGHGNLKTLPPVIGQG
jgi:hypothetical protein